MNTPWADQPVPAAQRRHRAGIRRRAAKRAIAMTLRRGEHWPHSNLRSLVATASYTSSGNSFIAAVEFVRRCTPGLSCGGESAIRPHLTSRPGGSVPPRPVSRCAADARRGHRACCGSLPSGDPAPADSCGQPVAVCNWPSSLSSSLVLRRRPQRVPFAA